MRIALGALLLASALASSAQTAAVRIGILGPDEEPRFSLVAAGLKQGLAEHGYKDATFQVLEGRTRRGDASATRDTIKALVARKPAVVFVIGSALVQPVREASAQVPVVFITPGDPVAAGIVGSLARPGGNMTAMTFEYPELSGKRMELLRETLPKAARVLVLFDSRDESPRQGAASARAAAAKMGVKLVERDVRSAEDIGNALKALDEADALLGVPGGITSAHYETMIRAANAKRRPAFFHTRAQNTREALLTYGSSDVDIARQAARMVDKILKGANAGDVPVERPTTLTLVINLNVARALGVTVPPALLVRANEIIE